MHLCHAVRIMNFDDDAIFRLSPSRVDATRFGHPCASPSFRRNFPTGSVPAGSVRRRAVPNRHVQALSKPGRPRQNQASLMVPPFVSRAAGDFLCYIL
jgi:hypothetical protein